MDCDVSWQDKAVVWILEQAQLKGGLAPVDVERFWKDQQASCADPWAANMPQFPLGVLMSGECVYDELGIPEDYWRYENDENWRLELNKAYNDKAEAVVGRRLLNESPTDPDAKPPPVKGLAELFEADSVWIPGTWSWWLQESASSEEELESLLDRVDARLDGDLRSFILPENWDDHKKRLIKSGAMPRMRSLRGPVTFATSIYGVERLVYLFVDNPCLLARLRDTILRAFLAIADILDAEAGDTPETAPHGFWVADDNCYLLTPEMYRVFACPILKGFFEHFSPNKQDIRYQHSDSAMGHLLPILNDLGINQVNFGPTVMIDNIRKYMSNALIYGQLAPFTFSRNQQQDIIRQCLRDFEYSRHSRGVVFSTAGSINNGSRLTGMRLIMSAIQNFCRYDNT